MPAVKRPTPKIVLNYDVMVTDPHYKACSSNKGAQA